MKSKILSLTLITLLVILMSSSAFCDDRAEKLLEEGKKAFGEKSWPVAMEKLELAREYGLTGAEAEELALYLGALYAQRKEIKTAAQYFRKWLSANPDKKAPPTFTEVMTVALNNTRLEFPVIGNVAVAREKVKPFTEDVEINFSVSAAETVMNATTVKFFVLDAGETTIFAEKEIDLNRREEIQSVKWDGRDRGNDFLKPGDYVIKLQAAREDLWKHVFKMEVAVDGNYNSEKAKSLMHRSRRIAGLYGQHSVKTVPDMKELNVETEPLVGTSKGMWNLVYYIFIGSIRDALDFPVKYVCSQPYIGHALTVALPVGVGYTVGQKVWEIDKEDYFDPLAGYATDAYNDDKRTARLNSAGMTVLAPVWALAYAGVMSVISWTGTEKGIVGGFNSYIESNAFNKGYDSRYFFPNYHSLDFSDTRVDMAALEEMNEKISKREILIEAKLGIYNDNVEKFNRNEMKPFKSAIMEKFDKELRDFVEMTVKKK